MTLKTLISDLREVGMTDAQIAASIGCSTSTVNMWVNGKRGVKTGNYILGLSRLHAQKCSAKPRKRPAPLSQDGGEQKAAA